MEPTVADKPSHRLGSPLPNATRKLVAGRVKFGLRAVLRESPTLPQLGELRDVPRHGFSNPCFQIIQWFVAKYVLRLADVCQRVADVAGSKVSMFELALRFNSLFGERLNEQLVQLEAVSYTHLTLPTIYSV